MENKNNEKIAVSVSMITIIGNVLLSAFKLLAGILGHSTAMISDAMHSLSDVLSTFIVIAGVKMSNKAPDQEHPYGHERMEAVASIILAVMLGATGIGIGISAVEIISKQAETSILIPSRIALVAAMVSIASKEGMYWYTRRAAKRIASSALMADAHHHRSDALSSIGSLVGIAGAQLGYPILDPLASIVICIFISKVAVDIFKDAIYQMVDHACDRTFTLQIEDVITKVSGVMSIDAVSYTHLDVYKRQIHKTA